MKPLLAALASGILFALGLGVSGMTQPGKIIAFLDVLQLQRAWDPSLAFVMAGALGVYMIGWRLSLRQTAPLYSASFFRPAPGEIDARLVGGAALFGVGWGVSGLCPGPAIVSVVSGAPEILAFVGAMVAGMWLAERRVLGRQALAA